MSISLAPTVFCIVFDKYLLKCLCLLLLDSPGRSPSQGNLTGTARKVKDAAADWHNYVKKWDGYVEEGSRIISRISNIRLERV